MLDLFKLRIKHGFPVISDLKNAKIIDTHRGFPIIAESKLVEDHEDIANICPVNAILQKPLSIDLGKCIFCGECERATKGAIKFTSGYKLGSSNRDHLVVKSGESYQEFVKDAIEAKKGIYRIFGHSLKFRQVSAGGCNGCELELNACGNVNFDMGRFGIDFVASPRHADGIVISGPITRNMAPALQDAYDSISDPRIVIAFGACTISGGIFSESDSLNRSFLDEIKIDLYVPGCPPHPLTFINSIINWMQKKI